MTLEEKEAKKVELRNAIEEAKTEEELSKVEEEIEALNNEPTEEAEVEQEEEPTEEEKVEEVEEEKEEEPQIDERSLLRNSKVIGERKMEENKVEFRNSKEYVEAYANYVKTGDIVVIAGGASILSKHHDETINKTIGGILKI